MNSILDRIKIATNANNNVLLPEDFASRNVARALFTPHERHVHASLRAIGYGTFESFAAAFGKHLIAAPEALDAAARAYESTNAFQREVEEVVEELGDKRDAELKRRVAKLTHHVALAADAFSVGLSDREYDQSKHRQPADFVILGGILDKRAKEIQYRDSDEPHYVKGE